MKTTLGLLSIVLALVGLLMASAGAFLPAIGLLALALLFLMPVWIRGPRRLALGSFVHFLIFTVLVLGNLACIHLLIGNRDWQWDLTANARQSLSPLTVRQVRALPDPIEIVAISADPAELKTHLDRLAALSPNFRYRILHPVRHHWEISRLASELQVANLGSGLVLVRAPATNQQTMFSVLQDGKFVFDEQRWTNAMILVTRAERPLAYFTSRSGERNLATEYAVTRRIIEDLSFEIEFGSPMTIPDEADLVVISGPTRDFDQAEIDVLTAFCDRGGSVLMLLDPPTVIPRAEGATVQPLTNLEQFVEDNGVRLPEGVVAEDADIGFEGGTNPLIARSNDSHPVSESFDPTQTPTVFQLARPLEAGDGNGEIRTVIETLIYTNATQTWISPQAEIGIPGNAPALNSTDRHAVCLGAAITRYLPSGAGFSRIVVFGDSDFLTNRIMESGLRDGSERLLRGALGWLVEEEDLIAIPPREPPVTPIVLTPQEQRVITALSVVLLPEILLAIGVLQLIARAGTQRDRRFIPALWGLAVPVIGFAALAAIMQGAVAWAVVAAIALLATVALGGRLRDAVAGRHIALWGTLGVGLLVAGLTWFGGGVISSQPSFPLHPLSLQALSRIEHATEIHTVAPPQSQLAHLIETMASRSPRLTCEILDPTADAETINALIQAHETSLDLGYTLINRTDGLTRKVTAGGDEATLVNALSEIGPRRPIRLHLTDGHGERSLSEEMITLEMIIDQLALDHEQGPLAGTDDPDLILIAGPTEDFTEREIAMLDQHAERGVGFLVFLDPPTSAAIRNPGSVVEATDLDNLIEWLETRWALSLPTAIVIDDDPQLQTPMTPPVLELLGDHPVTRRVLQRNVEGDSILILSEARPTGVNADALEPHIDATRLMGSRSSAWAEHDIDMLLSQELINLDDEVRGSQPLAVASQRHRGGKSARLFICGDSDILVGERPLIDDSVRTLINGSFRWVMPEDRWIHLADRTADALSTGDTSDPLDRARTLSGIAAIALIVGAAAGTLRSRAKGGPTAKPLMIASGALFVVALVPLFSAGPTAEVTGEHIIPFSQGQVERVHTATANADITLVREGDAWTMGDDATPADAESVDLLLAMLSSRGRHSQQAIQSSTDLQPLGLDEPRITITVTDRSGEEIALQLGVYPRTSHTQVWARIEGDSEVFTVDDDILTMALRDSARWEVSQ